MRHLALALVLLFGPVAARADVVCTLMADHASGRVLLDQGDCDRSVSPASTFKIAMSVMGFNAGVLTGAHTPAWPYREEYKAWRPEWKTTTDPTKWLKDSVVWYSWGVTRALGEARFQRYADAFDYGDRDLSGHPGRHDGLTQAWLSTSLQISPRQEVAFLRKLLLGRLPVSARAQQMTIAIVPRFDLPGGWVIHGKTGTASRQGADGAADDDRQLGWFVGWAQKDGRKIVFARLVRDEGRMDRPAGLRARDAFLAEAPDLLANR